MILGGIKWNFHKTAKKKNIRTVFFLMAFSFIENWNLPFILSHRRNKTTMMILNNIFFYQVGDTDENGGNENCYHR